VPVLAGAELPEAVDLRVEVVVRDADEVDRRCVPALMGGASTRAGDGVCSIAEIESTLTAGACERALSTGEVSFLEQAARLASAKAAGRSPNLIWPPVMNVPDIYGIGRARTAAAFQSCAGTVNVTPLGVPYTRRFMDPRKLAALAKKNAAKSGTTSRIPKGFGKKYDSNLADDPTDEATIKKLAESERFFAEMKKRDF
jgi:hypothetical protein